MLCCANRSCFRTTGTQRFTSLCTFGEDGNRREQSPTHHAVDAKIPSQIYGNRVGLCRQLYGSALTAALEWALRVLRTHNRFQRIETNMLSIDGYEDAGFLSLDWISVVRFNWRAIRFERTGANDSHISTVAMTASVPPGLFKALESL